MAETTGIAWTDSTFNPFIGCTKVSPGCDNCYAEAQDSRKRIVRGVPIEDVQTGVMTRRSISRPPAEEA